MPNDLNDRITTAFRTENATELDQINREIAEVRKALADLIHRRNQILGRIERERLSCYPSVGYARLEKAVA